MTSVERGTDRLVRDLRRVVSDSEELLRATSDAVGAGTERARKRLSAALETAKCTCEDLQDRTGKVARSAGKCLREHPYEALGIALLLGVLAGAIMRKR